MTEQAVENQFEDLFAERVDEALRLQLEGHLASLHDLFDSFLEEARERLGAQLAQGSVTSTLPEATVGGRIDQDDSSSGPENPHDFVVPHLGQGSAASESADGANGDSSIQNGLMSEDEVSDDVLASLDLSCAAAAQTFSPSASSSSARPLPVEVPVPASAPAPRPVFCSASARWRRSDGSYAKRPADVTDAERTMIREAEAALRHRRAAGRAMAQAKTSPAPGPPRGSGRGRRGGSAGGERPRGRGRGGRVGPRQSGHAEFMESLLVSALADEGGPEHQQYMCMLAEANG